MDLSHEGIIEVGCCNSFVEAFNHYEKEKGRQEISLSYASRREKWIGGRSMMKMEKKAPEAKAIIKISQSWLKPKDYRISFIYPQLKLSKDFTMSSCIIIPSFFMDLRE